METSRAYFPDEGERRAVRAIREWMSRNPGSFPQLRLDSMLESNICLWLSSRSERSDSMSMEETLFLNAVFPGWQSVVTSRFERNLFEARVFHSKHLRFPSAEADESNERVLGQWIARKASRRRDHSILLAEKKALDKHLPGWHESVPQSACRIVPLSVRAKRSQRTTISAGTRSGWTKRFAEMKAFYQKAHRLPSRSVADEQILARWVETQRQRLRRGSMTLDDGIAFLEVVKNEDTLVLKVSDTGFETYLKRLDGLQPHQALAFLRLLDESRSLSEHQRDKMIATTHQEGWK